ncbi:MAG: hypothetical protein OXP09_19605 [Gammaproteobacteria bacterium]|nr:hypothetical protein [Gammaproteobacteria bacterium]
MDSRTGAIRGLAALPRRTAARAGRWMAVAAVGALLHSSVLASGSIVAGGSINPRDAYVQGKSLTFKKLVCAGCPIQPGSLDRERALSLKNSLEARDEADKPGTEDDVHIGALERIEQEMVHYYLTRRYKL